MRSNGTLHIVIAEGAPVEQSTPTRLGNYEVLETIAQGGMGVVYKARHAGLDRVVALKMIRSGVLASGRDVERFQREARSAGKLRHPNIVTIHDIGEQDGQHYYTMDYVPGENLAERARTKPFSPRQAAEITAGVAAAIHYAHGQGVLHRDIKPANVILTAERQPRVLDFGLALVVTDDSRLTLSGTPLGSPPYMPPEQAAGQTRRMDARSDVYSLGALLYELLTGRPPFQAATTVETLKLVVENEAVSPRRLNPALPRDLETICLKCLEKAPEKRYQTAEDLEDELGRFIRDEPIIARPVSSLEKGWRWCRRKPLVASLSATTLALVVSVALGAPIALYHINHQRQGAEVAREEIRRRAYAAEISAGFHALEENNLGRAIELLNRQRPKPGEEDLRGFEWRYLWQLCQPDENVLLCEKNAGGVVRFSPDGRWLAYAAEKLVICEWPTRRVVATIPAGAGALSFSPQRQLLATGDGNGVRIWSTESWEEVRTLPKARDVAVFSPDGRWLVTATPRGYLVWNTDTWERPRFCAGQPIRSWVASRTVAFSPDGSLLVTGGHPGGLDSDQQFQVWDFPSLTVRSNFAPFPGRLGSVAFAPDGKHLLTGTGDGGLLLVWNVADGKIVETLKEHTGWVTDISYARDGRTFATASCDRTVLVWDAATWQVLVRLRGHLNEIWSVAMSPDGRMLASGSNDGTTRLWDATTRHGRRELENSYLITGVSPDSRWLVAAGYKDSKLWRLDDRKMTVVPLQNYASLHHRGFQCPLPACRDAHGIEPIAVYGRKDGILEVWNLAAMSLVNSWQAHEGEVAAVVFSPDGLTVATSGDEGDLRLWEAKTGRELRRFHAFGTKIARIVFSPDGKLLAGAEEKDLEPARVGIWEVNSGSLLREPDVHHYGVLSIAFSPDGKLLVTAERDSNAQVWDVASGTLRATLMGHIQAVASVAFSPDGKTLATAADDGKVKLWNVSTFQEVATLTLPGGCRSLKFLPDNRTLAVGYSLEPKSCIRLWEVPSFEEIAAVEAKEKGPGGARGFR